MQVDCECWFCVCRVVTDQFRVVCLFFLVNKQFLQVLMIYLTLKCTLAHSTSSNQGLSLILLGVLFFFSRSRAGLTNRVPVRDSRAGAPLPFFCRDFINFEKLIIFNFKLYDICITIGKKIVSKVKVSIQCFVILYINFK